jgi:hypothetical protein
MGGSGSYTAIRMSIAHTTLRELVASLARCQRALAAGDLDTARRAVEDALAIDGENVQARDLLRQIEQAPHGSASTARAASRPRTSARERLRTADRSESPAGGERVPHGVVPMGSWVAFEQRVRQRRVERLVTEAHDAVRDGRHEHAERAVEELGRLAPADERVTRLQQAVQEGPDSLARIGETAPAVRTHPRAHASGAAARRQSPAPASVAPVLDDKPPVFAGGPDDHLASYAPARVAGSHPRRRTAAGTAALAAAVLLAAALGGTTAYWHLAPGDPAPDAERQAAVMTTPEAPASDVGAGTAPGVPPAVPEDTATREELPTAAEPPAPGASPAPTAEVPPAEPAPAPPPAPASPPATAAAAAARPQATAPAAPAATRGSADTQARPARTAAAATPPATSPVRPAQEPSAPATQRPQTAEARPAEPLATARDTGPAASSPAAATAPPALARVTPPPAPPPAATPPASERVAEVPRGTAGTDTPAPAAAAGAAGAPAGVDASVVRTPPAAGLDVAARTVVDEYRQAFNSLDAMAAQRVWPTVDRRALDRAFRQLSTQSISFDRCEVTTTGAAGQAVCNGRATWAPAVGDRTPRDEPRTWRFTLAQRGSRWVITNAAVERN